MGPKAKLRALYAIVQPLAVRIDKQITEMPEDPPGQSAPEDGRDPWSAGRYGYEGYRSYTGGKTFDGRDMPEWKDLPERIREAWEVGIITGATYQPLVVVREAAAIEARPTPDITPMANAVAATEGPSEEERRMRWLSALSSEASRRASFDPHTAHLYAEALAKISVEKLFALAERVIFLERRVLYTVTELP